MNCEKREMVKRVKRGEDIINNRLTGCMPTSLREGESGERNEGGRRRRRENENAPGMILMLHLVSTFQAGKSYNIQPKIHRAGRWEHRFATCPSRWPFLPFMCQRETMVRLAAQQKADREWTVGRGEDMTRWRVGSGAKIKNITGCRTQGPAGHSRSAAYLQFSYFCSFFHNV